MTKRFHKHKLLLDENFPVRSYFPKLNGRYDLKHISNDLNLAGLSDDKIYKLAKKQQLIIVTYNVKDFAPLLEENAQAGIIAVSPILSFDQVDKKIIALLSRSTRRSLLGKVTQISAQTKVQKKPKT